MNCPQCANALAPRQLGQIAVDECRHCGGIWFDAGELEAYRMSVVGSQVPEDLLSRFRSTGIPGPVHGPTQR